MSCNPLLRRRCHFPVPLRYDAMLPITSNVQKCFTTCKNLQRCLNSTKSFYCTISRAENQYRLKLLHGGYKSNVLRSFFSSSSVLCTTEEVKTKPKSILDSIIQKKDDKGVEKTTHLSSEDTNNEEEAKKQKESAWRAMKYTFIAFGVSFSCLGTYLIYELGKPPLDPEGRLMFDEFSQMPKFKQYVMRAIRELDYYKRMIKEPSREKLLPDPLSFPYYQPPYTLVLELTDILVHPDWTYQTGWRFKKRPGLDHFLETVNGMFEVVIYTAEQGMTVFPLIEALDPRNIISYKLVRDATHFVDGHHVKSLDKLNRDLSKVVVIDWNLESVKFNPESVLLLPRWAGNDDDTTLIDLAAFLRTVAQSEIDDVREVLKYYNQFDDPLATFREKQKKLMEQQEAEKQKASTQEVPVVKRWAPSLLKRHL